MKRPWIKICGFTTPTDVKQAIWAGADLIGLNFHADSPRAISFGLGQQLSEVVKQTRRLRKPKRKVRTVAVFVNPDDDLVAGVLEHVKPDILQFHGNESPAFCESFKHPFIKAISLESPKSAEVIPAYMGEYAIGYLIDAYSPDMHGGTGRRLDLKVAAKALAHPKGFLAGGLNPDNVALLIERLQPFGVDVASGVETRPGFKSADAMSAFVHAVEQACKG